MDYYDILLAKKLNGGGGGSGGITPAIKTALLGCFSKVAWVDENGQDYYDTLHNALYSPADLSSISATYFGNFVVSSTPLDDLKQYLTITASWSDGSTSTVGADYYELSGTLTDGTSTITVSYLGKETTFSISVASLPAGYTKYDYIKFDSTNNSTATGILTDIAMSTDYYLETTVRFDRQVSFAFPLLGTRSGASGTKEFAIFGNTSDGKLGYWIDGTDTTKYIYPFSIGVKHSIKFVPVGCSVAYPTDCVIRVDHNEYSTGSTATNITFDPWLTIFNYGISATGINQNGTQSNKASIGAVIISDKSGNTLHYLVPATDNNNIIGYYDLFTSKWYAVTGTNASYFVCGNW